jgi:membrane protein implicated in regulation of membrane protease activity
MSGLDWNLMAVSASAAAIAALLGLARGLRRRRRRQTTARARLDERRIEIVAVEDGAARSASGESSISREGG